MGEVQVNYPSIFEKSHFGSEDIAAKGTYQAKRGIGPLNYISWLFVKVPIGEHYQPFSLTIKKGKDGDTWKRNFNGAEFITKLSEKEGVIKESRGPFSFEFRIDQKSEFEIVYRFKSFRLFGVKIPNWCAVKPEAQFVQLSETKWRFDVVTWSPINSLVVRYWGEAEI